MWAHSASSTTKQRHALRDHLIGTGRLAAEFARPWGGGALAAALGLFHDAGKASCAWQDRLDAVGSTNAMVGLDHKTAGTRLLAGVADYTAMAVWGHHGGLDTASGLRALLRSPEASDYAETVRRFYAELPEARPIAESERSLVPPGWLPDRLVGELGLRLAFSALVDADRLDTAAHRNGQPPAVRAPADMAALFERFERSRAKKIEKSSGGPRMAGVRAEVYREALAAAQKPPGIYRLPAPTGSGKTFAQAGFALAHAARHGMRRVVVAMPFITVTEQNATVYREMLDLPGEQVVLEHHSQVRLDGSGPARWAKLAAENWDAPFVVTTTVQLFESLLSRHPERMRKVHRLAGAVIVLDEVQALPPSLLVPILDVLKRLVTHFGSTVLLTSATQPAFEALEPWNAVDVVPVISEPARLFAQARRVRYRWEAHRPVTLSTLADRVAQEKQSLVVVNTTRDARRLARRAHGQHPAVLHLSTRMCPLHRETILAEVRKRLREKQPLLLVSTQLIETGVDIDFPKVFREVGPAESIHQAGGRANREWKLSLGTVVVFALRDGTPAPRAYAVPVDRTVAHFAGRAIGDIEDPERFTSYCAEVYDRLGLTNPVLSNSLLRPVGERIQDFRRILDFPEVERLFQMIDDQGTVPVVVPYGDEEQRARRTRLVNVLRRGTPRVEHLREVQRWMVNLPAAEATAAVTRADATDLVGDLLEWTGAYDDLVGITPPETPQTASPD